MCEERELDRDMGREDEDPREEIRRLFARYRDVSRHGNLTEREEPADGPEAPRVLAER